MKIHLHLNLIRSSGPREGFKKNRFQNKDLNMITAMSRLLRIIRISKDNRVQVERKRKEKKRIS